MKWNLLLLILVVIRCEWTQTADAVDFNYPSVQLASQKMQTPFAWITFPWSIIMHGRIVRGVELSSQSTLRFGGSRPSSFDLVMAIGESSDYEISHFSLFATDCNFTIIFNSTAQLANVTNSWSLTFYDTGFEKILLQVDSNGSDSLWLGGRSGYYQRLSLQPTIYSQCIVGGCSSSETKCSS